MEKWPVLLLVESLSQGGCERDAAKIAVDVPVDIFGAPVARFCRVPVGITAQLSYRNMYARPRQVALRMTDWLADRVVVNSNAVGESLTRESGLAADKIYLCYNGVNPHEFY